MKHLKSFLESLEDSGFYDTPDMKTAMDIMNIAVDDPLLIVHANNYERGREPHRKYQIYKTSACNDDHVVSLCEDT